MLNSNWNFAKIQNYILCAISYHRFNISLTYHLRTLSPILPKSCTICPPPVPSLSKIVSSVHHQSNLTTSSALLVHTQSHLANILYQLYPISPILREVCIRCSQVVHSHNTDCINCVHLVPSCDEVGLGVREWGRRGVRSV